MDLGLLSNMVAQLAAERHEVGLPGLGTFVSELVPASFTDRGYTINPPYKRVTFVPGTVTDNSLVELYARSNGISEERSRAALTEFLEDTRRVLLDRKTVVFPGLGRLRATRQNNIFFITDENLDIYPGGFGLEPVSLKNHEETPAELHHVVESLADILVAPAAIEAEPAAVEAAPEAVEPATEIVGEIVELAEEPASPEAAVQEPAEAKAAKAKAEAEAEAKAAAKAAKAEAKAAAKAERTAAREAKAEAKAAAKTARKAERAARRAARKPLPKWVWVTPLVIIAVAALAAGVFFILAYAAPDLLDTILYTPEELRIINW